MQVYCESRYSQTTTFNLVFLLFVASSEMNSSSRKNRNLIGGRVGHVNAKGLPASGGKRRAAFSCIIRTDSRPEDVIKY